MKYIAAYALLVLGGKETPSASDVETVLKSVGVEPEKERIDTLIKTLEGKKLHELIAAGSTKLSTLSVGGGSGAAVAGGAAAEEKAEEKEEEPQEEEADVGVGDIFGGDSDDY
uniref:Acidic ribosomal protein P2 n=1 Tax=Euplotoides octocarinatus TaxID=2716877 RepID=F6M1F0_EUPOC|nr:acidic ribosomal protein P2 [Euplotes octocarinatus]